MIDYRYATIADFLHGLILMKVQSRLNTLSCWSNMLRNEIVESSLIIIFKLSLVTIVNHNHQTNSKINVIYKIFPSFIIAIFCLYIAKLSRL